MTDREKLIELLMQAKIGWTKAELADHLIANGVIVLDEKNVTVTLTRNVGKIEFDYAAED